MKRDCDIKRSIVGCMIRRDEFFFNVEKIRELFTLLLLVIYKRVNGFAREIYEEIGIHIDARDAKRVHERIWKMDKIRPDGKDVHDRAFANVYVDLYEGDYQDFHFDPNEVLGLVLVDAKKVKKMFEEGHGSVVGTELTENHQQIHSLSRDISFDEFLVMEGETALSKYGEILDKVIALSCQE